MIKVVNVVGARPNFMKIAPIVAELDRRRDTFRQILVHTGQHYDEAMSETFFADLGIPRPDVNLEVGSGTHAEQTARIMLAFEAVVLEHRPDWVVVVGDVNSTIAATLVAVKLGARVAHVEAGLRSRDRQMPEEINRLATDAIADLLLTPSRDADANLLAEGHSPEKIVFVGNVMIDTLLAQRDRARDSTILETLGLESGGYAVLTLASPLERGRAGDARRDLWSARADCAAPSDRVSDPPPHPPAHARVRYRGVGADSHRRPARLPGLSCGSTLRPGWF